MDTPLVGVQSGRLVSEQTEEQIFSKCGVEIEPGGPGGEDHVYGVDVLKFKALIDVLSIRVAC